MKVNIGLTLSDQDRNLVARKIAGKDVKRLCSRADVVDLVNGFMSGYLTEADIDRANIEDPATPQPVEEPPDLSRVPDKYKDQTDRWKISYLRGRYGP